MLKYNSQKQLAEKGKYDYRLCFTLLSQAICAKTNTFSYIIYTVNIDFRKGNKMIRTI